MALYVDVFIPQPLTAGYEPTPNPCVLTLAANGIRFRNFSRSAVTIDLSGVPGFDRIGRFGVPANESRIASVDPSAVRAGVYDYQVASSGEALASTNASPRVILDV